MSSPPEPPDGKDREEPLDSDQDVDRKKRDGAAEERLTRIAKGFRPRAISPGGRPRPTQLPDWAEYDMGSLRARMDNLEGRVDRIQENYVDKNEATLRAIQITATAIAVLVGLVLTLLEVSRLL